jgi:hypothetical protein
MVNSNGIIANLQNALNKTSTTSASNTGIPAVNDQQIASFGSYTLGSNLGTQNVVQVPNYKGLDISSISLSIELSQVNGSTSPSGMANVETAIKTLEIQAANGKDIMRLDGSLYDISNFGRYLNAAGVVSNSPILETTASTTFTPSWNINIPFAIPASLFPLKLFVTFNTLSSMASTLNSMTVEVTSFKIVASYHKVNPTPMQLKAISIPVSATGTAQLNQYLDQGKTYYSQFMSYGDVQTSSDTDDPIASTGTGITFTPDGSLYISNASLQSFISKENNAYPNTVSTGVGHETGLVNLFVNPYVASAATQFSVDFTSTPSVAGNSDTVRLLAVESF